MRTTFPWAAPAVLLACMVGCSRDPAPAKNVPGPDSTARKSEAEPAVSAANLVTLHVEGMV